MAEIALRAMLEMLPAAAIGLIGLQFVRLLRPGSHWEDVLPLAFPIGAGGTSWTLFLVSWIGLPLTRASVLAVLLTLFVVPTVLIRRFGGPAFDGLKQACSASERGDRRASTVVAWGFVALLGLAAVVMAIGSSYSTWDAMAIWSVKGYGIAQEGTIFAGREWGAHRLSYPLSIPLLISTFRLTVGDLLPGSKLIFPLFWMSTLAGAYSFLRRMRIRAGLADLGLLMMATTPVLYFHATIGYANTTLACYVVLGTLWATEGMLRGERSTLLLSGTLLGFATWSREEGVLFAAAVLVGVAAAWRSRPQMRRLAAAWLAAALVVAVPWLVFFKQYGALGSHASTAMSEAFVSVLAGQLGLDSLTEIGRSLLQQSVDLRTWGLLFPTCLLLFMVGLPGLRLRQNSVALGLLLSVLTTGLATVSLYYVGANISIDLAGWLGRSLPRAFFPTAYLLAISALVIADRVFGGREYPRTQARPELKSRPGA